MSKPMMWIAYDPSINDHMKNREQFNGEKPAWGESLADFNARQGVDVPNIGDTLSLRVGYREVYEKRLEQPETDDNGVRVTAYYWTLLVR